MGPRPSERWICDPCSTANEAFSIKCAYCDLDYDPRRCRTAEPVGFRGSYVRQSSQASGENERLGLLNPSTGNDNSQVQQIPQQNRQTELSTNSPVYPTGQVHQRSQRTIQPFLLQRFTSHDDQASASQHDNLNFAPYSNLHGSLHDPLVRRHDETYDQYIERRARIRLEWPEEERLLVRQQGDLNLVFYGTRTPRVPFSHRPAAQNSQPDDEESGDEESTDKSYAPSKVSRGKQKRTRDSPSDDGGDGKGGTEKVTWTPIKQARKSYS